MSKGRSLLRLGFDEAGLGPTLGPLVVGGLATRVRGATGRRVAESPVDDLRGPLAAAVGEPGCRDGRIEVGDSKKIHTGTRKLARIERSALATVAWVHGRLPNTVAELLELVCDTSSELEADRRAPWWSMLDAALPIVGERGEIELAAANLREAATANGVEPLWYGADLVSAARVNRELSAEYAVEGTKNTWATHAVLRLVTRALDQVEGEQASVWCDKAGGRKAYAEPLVRAFPELEGMRAHAEADGAALPLFASGRAGGPGLEIVSEVRARSHYRLGLGARCVDLGFVMKGDRLDPRISWGSILAKYLRELILRSFNAYFVARIPGLRPTAGYPEDAKRFIADVRGALGEAGLHAAGLEDAAWIRGKYELSPGS